MQESTIHSLDLWKNFFKLSYETTRSLVYVNYRVSIEFILQVISSSRVVVMAFHFQTRAFAQILHDRTSCNGKRYHIMSANCEKLDLKVECKNNLHCFHLQPLGNRVWPCWPTSRQKHNTIEEIATLRFRKQCFLDSYRVIRSARLGIVLGE